MPFPAFRNSDAAVRPGPLGDDAGARPFILAAALSAAVAVLVSLGLCMAVALIAWFFADSGAHGSTIDALRAGGLAWALGLGGSADTAIGHVGLTPLGLTGIEVVAVVRAVRWGWRRYDIGKELPVRNVLLTVWGVFVGTYAVLVVILAELLTSASVSLNVPSALRSAVVIAAVGSAWGGLLSSMRSAVLWSRLPVLAQGVLRIAVWAACVLVAVAAGLVAISLATSFSNAKNTYEALGVSFGDGLILTLICALSLPNAVGFAVAYLVGPGFAVGTGTSVTVTSVSLGALPLFPTVAALPDPGTQPGWLIALLFVPPLCGLVAAARVQRDFGGDGWDQVLLRGLGGGALAGLALTVFAVVSGGALGDHRMAEIGAAFWPVLVCAVGGMALGGALGSLGRAAWQRWRTAH